MNRKRKNGGDLGYWETSTDLMSGLVLMLLLLVLLLILRITWQAETEPSEFNPSEEMAEESPEASPTPTVTPYYEDDDDDGGDGGDEEDDETFDEDDEEKAAVYLRVVDGESGKVIPVSGMRFALYSDSGALQKLQTYYPKRISYQEYETTEQGGFYLPEKISRGDYYFENLVSIDGYDTADDAEFTVDEAYEWSDPLVVTATIYPHQNTVLLTQEDAADGSAISGGSYDLVAAADVLSADGSVRYAKGEVCDTVTIGEDGTGESAKLYLGSYTVRSHETPAYYASPAENPTVEVVDGVDASCTLSLRRTTVTLKLVDELNQNNGLSDVEFHLEASDGSVDEILTTDEDGEIFCTDLLKETEYTFTQLTYADGYLEKAQKCTVKVDADGRIDGASDAQETLTNRILQLRIGVQDRILRSYVKNISAELQDSSGQTVVSWTTGSSLKEISGVTPGTYRLILDADTENPFTITVEDTAKVQTFAFSKLTTTGIAACAGAAVLLAAVLAGFIVLLVKRGKKKKNQKHSLPDNGL